MESIKDDQSRVTVNKIYTIQFQEQALSDLENEKEMETAL